MTATPTMTDLAIVANTAELRDCLAAVSLATKRTSPLATLKCVRLTASNSRLTLEATDGTLRIRRVANAMDVRNEGVLLVPCVELLDQVAECDGDSIVLEVDAKGFRVAGASCHRYIPTITADQFPEAIPDDGESGRFTVKLGDLRNAVRFVKHSVPDSSADLRFCHNGIYIGVENDQLAVVGCDLRRLSLARIEGSAFGTQGNAIIPVDTLDKATRAMADADDDVMAFIVITGSTVRVESGDTWVWSARLQGNYPPYTMELPDKCDGSATVSREAFLAAVRQASTTATDLHRKMAFEATPGVGFKMSLTSGERGHAESRLPCRIDGEAVRVGLNARSILEAVNAMDGDEIDIAWRGPKRSIKFSCGGNIEMISPMDLTE